MTKGPYDKPSTVIAEHGEVHVDGPDGVAVALTPEAALETGDRLIEGATEAMGQKAMIEAGKTPVVPK